jgi:hypothetical protein
MSQTAANDRVLQTSSTGLTPQTAIRVAWVIWLVFLVTPFFLFLRAVWILSNVDPNPPVAPQPEVQHWFLGSMLYLLLAVPISFFARSHVFKAYWSGKCVTPGKYLSGMMTVWLALELGGLISLTGCLVTHQLLPNVLPALVAFMFYATLWPSGRAMVRAVGHSEDAAVYEEPR